MVMVWKQATPMSERVKLVSEWIKRKKSVSALAAEFGVSRKTAHKWIARYEKEGAAGLHDRSRRPLVSANATPASLSQPIVKLRRAHPTWGPRKLKARLEWNDPSIKWPAASTIGDVLMREGLVTPRRVRERIDPMTAPFSHALEPNDVWSIDFKGWWRTGDGGRIEPLTLSDAVSRYLFVCQSVKKTDFETVWPLFAGAVHEYGLPKAVRSDNGSPFASLSAGGLSRFSVHLIKMGIFPERIAPGKPQENGRHERMHLTMKNEVASPPARTARAQAAQLRCFQQCYNHERPHEALGQVPPATVHKLSPRAWDGHLIAPEHADATLVRYVHYAGHIKWRGEHLFVSQVLKNERIGIYQTDDNEYDLRFGPVLLGRINKKNKLKRLKTKRQTRNTT
jgi:putative transposase